MGARTGIDLFGGRHYHSPRRGGRVSQFASALVAVRNTRRMETTLHRQLKQLYAGDAACEVRVDGYRIDAVANGRLIEIQQGSLSALRTKVSRLLERHEVLVVKPLFAHKTIIRLERRSQREVSRRVSPAHDTVWDAFQDLVHFVDVFPHPRLTLEVVLTEVEEHRPANPRIGWRQRDRAADRTLLSICGRHTFRTNADLLALLPDTLPAEFTTALLAEVLELPRWWAQKVAYCLRRTGALETTRRGRAGWVYRRPPCRAA